MRRPLSMPIVIVILIEKGPRISRMSTDWEPASRGSRLGNLLKILAKRLPISGRQCRPVPDRAIRR